MFCADAVIVAYVWKALFGAEATHFGVKVAPICAVFPGVYVAQFRMVQMNPIQDTAFVVTAEIEIFKPNKIAEVLRPQDNFLNISDVRDEEPRNASFPVFFRRS